MIAYTRPDVRAAPFRDAEGRVIPYGHRWGSDGPPEDMYSVATNPDRFAPLHAVADALIDHLRSAYDAAVSEGPEHAADLLHPPDDVIRAVRLAPADPGAAPLTLVFTRFPAVVVQAGLLHQFPFPGCGCDACDETWETQADELEWQVLSVAAGGYRESVRPSEELGIEFELRAPDGSRRRSGRARPEDVGRERLRTAVARLRALDGAWRPWPLRPAT